MSQKLLLVDDDTKLLNSFKRLLGRHLQVDTATSGQEGLDLIAANGPYAILISDYKMPGMNGVDFLAAVAERAPDTVRVLLTAHANLEMAIDAVNKGDIFRLLTKPCSKSVLAGVIKSGLEQYRLVTAERDLLEKTLTGAMKLLGELLQMLYAEAYESATHIQPLLRTIVADMELENVWALESAAVLSQLGYALLPVEIREKVRQGKQLTAQERARFDAYPETSRELISHIPRLEVVALIAKYAEKHYDGSGIPQDDLEGDSIPPGARILKVLIDYDRRLSRQVGDGQPTDEDRQKVVKKMRSHAWYDPDVVDKLAAALEKEKPYRMRTVPISQLKETMILAEDIFITKGGNTKKIMTRGHEITRMGLEYLRNYAKYLDMNAEVQVIELQ